MRTYLLKTLLACVVVLLVAVAVGFATHTPGHMNVQGRLTDSAGEPVPPGIKQFTFKIFDAEVGGTKIWPAGPGEDQAIATDENGLWDATVGANYPLSHSVFADTARWLEITVDDGVNPAETLSRVRINTSPFVWMADEAEHADSANTVEDDAVTSAKIAPGAVEGSDINQSGATAGQVMTWNGSQWTAANTIPAGVIVMWSGTAATIPPGWALCDGTNGTPDLRNRFIYGGTDAGETGGSATASQSAHLHSYDTPGFYSNTCSDNRGDVSTIGWEDAANAYHNHYVNPPSHQTYNAGGFTISIIPPYYQLAFIMKL